MCDVDGTDPFTAEGRLCDDDGIVGRGAMHRGKDYACTGHAHFAGQHIRCTNPVHVREFNPTPGPWYPATLALRDRIQSGGTIRLSGPNQSKEVTFR